MKILVVLIIFGLSELRVSGARIGSLEEEYSWTIPEFKFPNASVKNVALSTGSYIPENNNINAVGIWKDKIFVVVFRLRLGVASSFNYFFKNCGTKSPVLIPYPSFDANYLSEDPNNPTLGLPSDSSVINTLHFRIDKCDRLWIVDAGNVDFFKTNRMVAPPAIVIFDLKRDTLIRRYTVPSEFSNSISRFVTLEIDMEKRCDDAYAYISDLVETIVVYSFKKNRSWHIHYNNFRPEPCASFFEYNGINFKWSYGILGITLGERHHDGSRRVYLKPFSSIKTYYISNKVLQDESYIAQDKYQSDIYILGERAHSFRFAFDENTNVLFDAQFGMKRIGCWSTATSYINANFDVVYETDKNFFPFDVNIDKDRNLWVVANDYPIFAYGTWNSSAKNIIIYKGKVDDLIFGTVCKLR